LNTDGTIDDSFIIGNGFNFYVNKIALQSDNKILVGGNFTTYSGVTANRIIRLNLDGSIDDTFVTGSGFDQRVYAIVQQPDGKILVGGDFTTYNGTTTKNFIRLNDNGTIDNTFVGIEAIGGASTILVGGDFLTYSGITRYHLVRLYSDGTLDNSFMYGTGFDYSNIFSLLIDPYDKIFVVGGFTTYNGVTANSFIKLNNDGSPDGTFVTGTGFDGAVYTIMRQLDGKIIAGGPFFQYNGGPSIGYIIRLKTDGSADI
jgi:uncharacterized delta-60 repeat protein